MKDPNSMVEEASSALNRLNKLRGESCSGEPLCSVFDPQYPKDEPDYQPPETELGLRVMKALLPSRCRECADSSEEGRCPHDGELCDVVQKALEIGHAVDAAVKPNG